MQELFLFKIPHSLRSQRASCHRGSHIVAHRLNQRMGLTWVARLSRFKGCNLFKEGQYEEAVEAFTKAISIEPDEIAGYSNRCAALMKLERWEEVILDASRCLELDPK